MILKKILEFCIQVGKTVQVNVSDLFFLILLFFFSKFLLLLQNFEVLFSFLKVAKGKWRLSFTRT